MASNLSQITEAIKNLNTTFEEIATEKVIDNAIVYTDQATNGWLGILLFAFFIVGVVFHFITHQNKFQINNGITFALLISGVAIDLALPLLLYGIISSVQVFMFLITGFFIIATVSLIVKELNSLEQM